MTVTENTPERLIVDFVPWANLGWLFGFMSLFVACTIVFLIAEILVGAILFFALGVVVPAVIIWRFVQRHQLILTRAAGTLELRSRSFRGYVCHPLPLDGVVRIYAAPTNAKQGQIMIETRGGMDAGHHSFPSTTTAPLAPTIAAVDAITAWQDGAAA